MIKTEIKLNNGTLIKIEGSAEETKKILELYPKSVKSISEKPEQPNLQTETKEFKSINWIKTQIGKYIQPCNTPKCKYNYKNCGSTICKTPNPRADDDDVKRENHENYHPFWNFYCMRFVRTAYNTKANYPKAEDMYQSLSKNGKIQTSEDIPEGALVFWHWSSYGHIGIYTNNGMVAHTGVNPSKKKVGVRESLLTEITEVLDGYNHYESEGSRTSYLGWAYPPKDWLD